MGLTLVAPAWAQEPTELKVDAAQEPASGSDDESFTAKAKRIARETQIVERLNGDIDGWYPKLGGMTTGSGLALGPGYRTHVLDDKVFVDLSAAISTKNYKTLDVNVRWLQALNNRVELWTNYGYQDYPQQAFFGLGGGSTLRTNYTLTSHDVSALGVVNATRWLRVGTDLGYFMPSIGRGHGDHPSTDTVFNDTLAPGLLDQPDFMHSTTFAEVDYRDVSGNPRKGGFYRISYGIWDDASFERYDHHRFEGSLAHYVPVRGPRHVIANRVGFAYVNNTEGERVPFYFLPYVGGHDTIRAYEEFRFQDENAFWINTEYRYAAMKYVEVALFFDAGEVRADWEEIGVADLKTGYGFGFRFGTSKRIFARLDVGMGGGEGRQVFFKMGPSF
jgi:outer membrane protein assembly factor BamA